MILDIEVVNISVCLQNQIQNRTSTLQMSKNMLLGKWWTQVLLFPQIVQTSKFRTLMT